MLELQESRPLMDDIYYEMAFHGSGVQQALDISDETKLRWMLSTNLINS